LNDVQRQLLADELDNICRSAERYKTDIANLERQLAVKKTNLEKLLIKKAKLEEGVDW
jgi:hypothetical protein